jgi:hypothetical protein
MCAADLCRNLCVAPFLDESWDEVERIYNSGERFFFFSRILLFIYSIWLLQVGCLASNCLVRAILA